MQEIKKDITNQDQFTIQIDQKNEDLKLAQEDLNKLYINLITSSNSREDIKTYILNNKEELDQYRDGNKYNRVDLIYMYCISEIRKITNQGYDKAIKENRERLNQLLVITTEILENHSIDPQTYTERKKNNETFTKSLKYILNLNKAKKYIIPTPKHESKSEKYNSISNIGEEENIINKFYFSRILRVLLEELYNKKEHTSIENIIDRIIKYPNLDDHLEIVNSRITQIALGPRQNSQDYINTGTLILLRENSHNCIQTKNSKNYEKDDKLPAMPKEIFDINEYREKGYYVALTITKTLLEKITKNNTTKSIFDHIKNSTILKSLLFIGFGAWAAISRFPEEESANYQKNQFNQKARLRNLQFSNTNTTKPEEYEVTQITNDEFTEKKTNTIIRYINLLVFPHFENNINPTDFLEQGNLTDKMIEKIKASLQSALSGEEDPTIESENGNIIVKLNGQNNIRNEVVIYEKDNQLAVSHYGSIEDDGEYNSNIQNQINTIYQTIKEEYGLKQNVITLEKEISGLENITNTTVSVNIGGLEISLVRYTGDTHQVFNSQIQASADEYMESGNFRFFDSENNQVKIKNIEENNSYKITRNGEKINYQINKQINNIEQKTLMLTTPDGSQSLAPINTIYKDKSTGGYYKYIPTGGNFELVESNLSDYLNAKEQDQSICESIDLESDTISNPQNILVDSSGNIYKFPISQNTTIQPITTVFVNNQNHESPQNNENRENKAKNNPNNINRNFKPKTKNKKRKTKKRKTKEINMEKDK
ncbi:MAG: hypothetical protein N4A49_03305 [Marinifilaceae bacterium]|jgi:hypothetical protein|nr:hypothetical protein [Marinifilaceae bacterium]